MLLRWREDNAILQEVLLPEALVQKNVLRTVESLRHLLVLVTICLASDSAISVERVFGVFPRNVIPAVLATNVARDVFLPGALNLRLGMTREEVFRTCPILEYDGEFGRKYFLRFARPIILQNELKGIEFSGGVPQPNRETVIVTVEWLLYVFGTPVTAFEEKARDEGRFGLIWKRNDFAVACWFASSEFGKKFYAYLKLLPASSNMEKVLSSRTGRELPKNSQSILTSLRSWSQSVAQLEPKRPELYSPGKPSASQPAASVASFEKYEVLSGEGLAGSGFIIRHRNTLYGICSLHQFEGKTPGSLEPIQGPVVQLEKTRAIRQKDAQAIPLRFSQQRIQSLTYNADFTLRPGEEVLSWVPLEASNSACLPRRKWRQVLIVLRKVPDNLPYEWQNLLWRQEEADAQSSRNRPEQL